MRLNTRMIFFAAVLFISSSTEGQLPSYFTQSEQNLSANTESLSQHGKLTQITYFGVNYVNQRIQGFLDKKMGVTMKGNPEYQFTDSSKAIKHRYHKKIQTESSQANKSLNITFKVFPYKDDLIIKKCLITGHFDYVLEFFVKYWNTKIDLNIDAIKENGFAKCRLWQDKIVFKRDLNTGEIIVSNTTIKNPKALLSELSKK